MLFMTLPLPSPHTPLPLPSPLAESPESRDTMRPPSPKPASGVGVGARRGGGDQKQHGTGRKAAPLPATARSSSLSSGAEKGMPGGRDGRPMTCVKDDRASRSTRDAAETLRGSRRRGPDESWAAFASQTQRLCPAPLLECDLTDRVAGHEDSAVSSGEDTPRCQLN